MPYLGGTPTQDTFVQRTTPPIDRFDSVEMIFNMPTNELPDRQIIIDYASHIYCEVSRRGNSAPPDSFSIRFTACKQHVALLVLNLTKALYNEEFDKHHFSNCAFLGFEDPQTLLSSPTGENEPQLQTLSIHLLFSGPIVRRSHFYKCKLTQLETPHESFASCEMYNVDATDNSHTISPQHPILLYEIEFTITDVSTESPLFNCKPLKWEINPPYKFTFMS